MPWNPWIQIEGDKTSNQEAKDLYKKTTNPITGKLSDLTRISSLTPKVSELIHKLNAEIFNSATGLSAREKEIAALVTSSFIGCVH